MKFCEKIKQIRIDNNLTQEEMATRLFVSRSLIAKWEQNRGIPNIDMLNTISTTFNLTINDLISDDEIRLISLKNNREIQKNKTHLKISLIIGSIILIALIIIMVILISTIDNKKYNIKDFYIRGEIIEIEDDFIKVKNSENIQEINFDWITTYRDQYDEYYNPDNLKVGQYVEISGSYYEFNDVYDYKLNIIEEYVDDYLLYGFVITLNDTIPESRPLWGTDLDENTSQDKPSDDCYPYFLAYLNSDGRFDYSSYLYFDYNIKHNDNSSYGGSYDIELSINIDLNKKVNVFAIDNSIKGFTLIKSMEAIPQSRSTRISLEGYIINENLKNAKEKEYLGFSSKVKYKLTIFHSFVPDGYTIYEYDANNQLIKETNFSTYNDYKASFKGASKETVYCIMKKLGVNATTKKVYLGEVYSFQLFDEFGYTYEFDDIIN